MVYDSSSFITMKLYAGKMLLDENNGGNMLYDVRESFRNLTFCLSFQRAATVSKLNFLLVFRLKQKSKCQRH